MKACPSCGRLYPVDAGFCPVDGAQLISATQVPVQAEDDKRVGELLFERYQLRRVVADGGMGRVYEALDMAERRNVAVKILHAEVARDPVQVERFKREFEVSEQLPHEHIVEVLDFRPTKDDSYALIMEFLYGEELSATLSREKSLSSARLVRMMSQVAVGLDEAHARKLVHRDLKPDNLFLCQTPEGDIVKILDFGSVKDKAEGAKKLTMMGTTIGSPYYMAPEQAQGLDTLDHRADVWALGAITFELVTGQVPFQGHNGPSILLEILTKEAPLVSDRAKGARYPVPPTLDPVLARTFKKVASLRYASVGEFADALGQAYGLSGSHIDWAETPEGSLQEQISAALPRVMQAARTTVRRTAQDDFFGEGDSLGEVVVGTNKRPASNSERPGRVTDRGVESEPQSIAGVPGASSGVSVLWIVAGVLVILALLVLAFVL